MNELKKAVELGVEATVIALALAADIDKMNEEIENLKSERTALLATEQNLRQANAELLRWIEQTQDEAIMIMGKHWGAR